MARPGIPGLDVTEVSGMRDVVPSTRPDWVYGNNGPVPTEPGTAVFDPKRPNWAPPNTPPGAEARQPFDAEAGKPSRPTTWANRMRDAAAAVNDLNTRQSAAIRAPIDAAAQGVRNFSAGVRNVAGAAGELGAAVFNNPVARVVGGAIAAPLAIGDAADAQAAHDKGDNLTASSKGASAVGGAASMLPGPAGAVGAAYTVGHGAGTLIDKGLQRFAPDFRDKVGSLFASSEERNAVNNANQFAEALKTNAPFTPSAAPAPAAPAPAAAPPPFAERTDAQVAASRAAAAQALSGPQNLVSRTGNDFSGNNIREGFRYEDGAGSRPSTGSMSVLHSGPGGFGPGMGGLGGQDTALAEARAAAANRGDFNAVAQSYGGGGGGGGGYAVGGDMSRFDGGAGNSKVPSIREMKQMGLSTRQAYAQVAQAQALAEQARATNVNASTQMAGINTNANVATRGQDLNQYATLRGQDATLAGHRMANDVARANMMREQFNADRTYKAGRDDQNFKERQDREQGLQRNIESTAPLGPDGKPDQNYVRGVRSSFDRSAARLGLQGPHEFTPRDEQRLMAAHDLSVRLRSDAGPLSAIGLGPEKLKTIDPVDLTDLRVLSNGDRQITRKDSKAMGQTIPGRYFDNEEANRLTFGGIRGTPTNRYDMLDEAKK